MDSFPLWCGRLVVTVFFAIAFLQSAADKWLDSQGNLAFLRGHFACSPLRCLVAPLFWVIAGLESVAGVLCAVGTVQLLVSGETGIALWGLLFSTFSLLCLFFGQRLAKDYGGAVVIASYVAVALLGLLLMGLQAGA